jgi:hypothetical protein
MKPAAGLSGSFTRYSQGQTCPHQPPCGRTPQQGAGSPVTAGFLPLCVGRMGIETALWPSASSLLGTVHPAACLLAAQGREAKNNKAKLWRTIKSGRKAIVGHCFGHKQCLGDLTACGAKLRSVLCMQEVQYKCCSQN